MTTGLIDQHLVTSLSFGRTFVGALWDSGIWNTKSPKTGLMPIRALRITLAGDMARVARFLRRRMGSFKFLERAPSPGKGFAMRRRPGGYTVTCPYCRTRFLIGGYTPGRIRCGACGKVMTLR